MISEAVRLIIAERLSTLVSRGERVLLIVPDTTRTAPVGELVQNIVPILKDCGAGVDIIVALGTHPALAPDLLRRHLGMPEGDPPTAFRDVRLMNHTWDQKETLFRVGTIDQNRVAEITGGLMAETVHLTLNSVVRSCDRLLVLGPVFPHEIAGFSGGSKYLFPGISGPEIIDIFHWLGALITNLEVIGTLDNPVRRMLDEAAGCVDQPVDAVSFVVHGGAIAHVSVGPLVQSWRVAAAVSSQLHVLRKPRKYHRVLSCAPQMYEDLWTGGKCMYKVEPVVEDGGEVIIYAPHVSSFSVVHGQVLNRIGYHVRDYFLKQMDRFMNVPRAIMAVSTYVKGAGTFEDGVERPRIRVSVASRIPRECCERVGLGYEDPDRIRFGDWKAREDDGVLLVERAGETLYVSDDRNLEGGTYGRRNLLQAELGWESFANLLKADQPAQ